MRDSYETDFIDCRKFWAGLPFALTAPFFLPRCRSRPPSIGLKYNLSVYFPKSKAHYGRNCIGAVDLIERTLGLA
jgi:hypothetical protein